MTAGLATPFVVLAVAATAAVLVYATRLVRRAGTRSEWRGVGALALGPLVFGALGALTGHMGRLQWRVALGPAFGDAHAAEAAAWVRTPLLVGVLGTLLIVVIAVIGRTRVRAETAQPSSNA